MRTIQTAILILFVGTAGAFGQTLNSLTPQEKAQGWQLMFDGKTLNGWHTMAPAAGRGGRAAAPPAPAQPGDLPAVGSSPTPCVANAVSSATIPGTSHWQVVAGTIAPCGEPAGNLLSDQQHKNFVLTLEFKTGADTNSGVFIRSGYEVQIWRKQPQGYNTGAIVNTAKTAHDFTFKPDQWNQYEITADGDHLVVKLNGETTVDTHNDRLAEGEIRLQYQQYPIAFRNIKIRPLP